MVLALLQTNMFDDINIIEHINCNNNTILLTKISLTTFFKNIKNQENTFDFNTSSDDELNSILDILLGKKNDSKTNKTNRFMTSEQSQYQWLNSTAQKAIFQNRKDKTFKILARMRAIYDSKTKTNVAEYLMENLKGRKLFFCSSIKQAEHLCKNTYHSKTDNKDLKKFQSGEVDDIAMVNAGGTGFTYKEIDHLIMVQADSDNNGLTSQKICRTLLKQKDYKATIWIISLIGTQDEKWVKSALENFDKSKVEYLRFKNLINGS